MALPSFSVQALCAMIVISCLLQNGLGNRHPPTCTALDQYVFNTADTLATCRRDDLCTTVTCDSVLSTMTILQLTEFTLQPCTLPPSIRLQVSGMGNVHVDTVLNASAEVFVGQENTVNIFLNITIDNSIEGEIGLESDLSIFLAANGMPVSNRVINTLTRIPLDLQSCAPDTTMATVSSTSNGVKLSSNLLLAISLALLVILTLQSMLSR